MGHRAAARVADHAADDHRLHAAGPLPARFALGPGPGAGRHARADRPGAGRRHPGQVARGPRRVAGRAQRRGRPQRRFGLPVRDAGAGLDGAARHRPTGRALAGHRRALGGDGGCDRRLGRGAAGGAGVGPLSGLATAGRAAERIHRGRRYRSVLRRCAGAGRLRFPGGVCHRPGGAPRAGAHRQPGHHCGRQRRQRAAVQWPARTHRRVCAGHRRRGGAGPGAAQLGAGRVHRRGAGGRAAAHRGTEHSRRRRQRAPALADGLVRHPRHRLGLLPGLRHPARRGGRGRDGAGLGRADAGGRLGGAARPVGDATDGPLRPPPAARPGPGRRRARARGQGQCGGARSAGRTCRT